MRLKGILLGGLLVLSASFAQASGRPVAIMEILFLNKGQTTEQAEAFLAKMHAITLRYKAKPIAGMHLKKWLRGGKNRIYDADYVVGTEFPSQSAMNKMLQEDKDYERLLFERDTVFNSEMGIMFLVDSLEPD